MAVPEIRHGSVRKSLEAWGIKAGTCFVTHGERGGDALEFATDERLADALTFTPLAQIEFFDAAGVRQFLGVVLDPVRVARGGPGGSEGRAYRCASPSYWLAARQYAEDWKITTSDVVEDTEPTLVDAALTISILGRDTSAVTIAAAVQVVKDAGAPIDLDESYVPGEETDEGATPEDRQEGLTCLGAIERVLDYFPYVTWRWDFDGAEGGAARMQFFSTLRPSHSIGSLPDTQLDVQSIAASDVEQLDGGIIHGLLISKMTVIFIEPQRVSYESAGDRVRIVVGKRTSIEATRSNGAFREEMHTIVLRPAYWDGSGYVDAEQPIATLARQLGAAYFYPPGQLAWREKGAQPNFARRPCALYNATGAGSDLETAHAVLRTARHNVFTGETAVECGPAPQPGIDALAELLRKLRSRKPPTAADAGGQTYGFAPDGEDAEGSTDVQLETWVNTAGGLVARWVTVRGVSEAGPTERVLDTMISGPTKKLVTVLGKVADGAQGEVPAVPPSGTHVLGSVAGTKQWIETDTCESV